MEPEQSTVQPMGEDEAQSRALAFESSPVNSLVPQQGQPCPTCGNPASLEATGFAAPRFVYALGRIEPRFPSLSVEKEFAQAVGRAETVNLTDRQALQAALTRRENRYLARQLCWVMTISGLETYLLGPRDPMDLDLLAETLRPNPGPLDLDMVVGVRGPIAPPEMCNGLMVPMVVFDQIYTFDRDSFVKSVPRPKGYPAGEDAQYRASVGEVFDRMMLMTDNAGAEDEHRALNYLAVRYPAIYERAAQSFRDGGSLTGVEVRPSRLSGVRKIVDVIFSYTDRQTDVVDQYFVRVDVTEEFPFLVTRMSPYFER